jgi:hypothetical protein
MGCGFSTVDWYGATSLVVKPEHAGKRLGAVLRKLYPTLNPDALARMVNGYAPPEMPGHERVPSDSKEATEPARYIFLDDAPTKLSARLREGQWITLPDIEPFVSDVPFDDLARLPWPEGYSDKYRKAYLDRLFIEPKAVLAWLARKEAPTPMPTPLRGHATRSAVREWYRVYWVKGGKSQEWMKERGHPSTVTPNADKDLLAAREKFGKGVSRGMIREARRDFAPTDWTDPGKRKL